MEPLGSNPQTKPDSNENELVSSLQSHIAEIKKDKEETARPQRRRSRSSTDAREGKSCETNV